MLFEQVAGPVGADRAPGEFCCGLWMIPVDDRIRLQAAEPAGSQAITTSEDTVSLIRRLAAELSVHWQMFRP